MNLVSEPEVVRSYVDVAAGEVDRRGLVMFSFGVDKAVVVPCPGPGMGSVGGTDGEGMNGDEPEGEEPDGKEPDEEGRDGEDPDGEETDTGEADVELMTMEEKL